MFGLNDKVLLKSRVGSLHLRRRVQDPLTGGRVEDYDWGFDNDFQTEVPREWWEELKDQYLDKQAELRYRQALYPL